MPTPHKEFAVGDLTLRFRPWSAFRALDEWGKLGADAGESILELFLTGGIASIVKLSEGGIVEIAQTAIDWFGAEDLGARVKYYLDSCDVEVKHGDVWLPLHGGEADATVEAVVGVDAFALLEVAWYCVREGLRPLSDRLALLVAGQETA